MNDEHSTILIVEDEPAIAELISYAVRGARWTPSVAASSAAAWSSIRQRLPQLILLDWMLPDQSGLQLLARLRADRQLREIPVIMLTARSMEEDKVTGLEQGADDYITKPFSPRELVARMRALLRRKSPEHAQQPLQVGAILLEPDGCAVSVDGVPIEIGATEYRLLKFLMAHPERVFSRAQLLDKVWGQHVALDERTVDVHVLRLRRVLRQAGPMIRTVRGAGYLLSAQPA